MNIYKRHSFPPEIIQYAVWHYHLFNLCHRDIEDLLHERGVEVSYESISLWCNKLGSESAKRLKRKHNEFGDILFTDKMGSYPVAHKELMPDVIHYTSQYANNKAELSHQPTRVRERGIRKFKSITQGQRFLSVHAEVYNLFNLGRHCISAKNYKMLRHRAIASWRNVVTA